MTPLVFNKLNKKEFMIMVTPESKCEETSDKPHLMSILQKTWTFHKYQSHKNTKKRKSTSRVKTTKIHDN